MMDQVLVGLIHSLVHYALGDLSFAPPDPLRTALWQLLHCCTGFLLTVQPPKASLSPVREGRGLSQHGAGSHSPAPVHGDRPQNEGSRSPPSALRSDTDSDPSLGGLSGDCINLISLKASHRQCDPQQKVGIIPNSWAAGIGFLSLLSGKLLSVLILVNIEPLGD